ncbi:MAG TPA: hypothetical protein VKS79_02475 [Gemmataceae bacterium]|nr:hypothetical protein [Gemmataceae bacterium]
MKKWLFGIVVAALPSLVRAEPPTVGPQVTITLQDRNSQALPQRQGFTHTGGGNIDVTQPAPDTIVISMTGVAVAGAHPIKDSTAAMIFELDQLFEINFENPKVKRAKVTLEGRLIGLLRTHPGSGSAAQGPAHAALACGNVELLAIEMPSHCVTGGENLSVNMHQGPAAVGLVAGQYHLHQTFTVSAAHPRTLKMCKASSSEFAPDPALDPLWISYWEPFHGALKKDFGFQVTLKISPDIDGNGPEQLGKPMAAAKRR